MKIGSVIRIGKVKLKVTFLKIRENEFIFDKEKENNESLFVQENQKEIIEENLNTNEQGTCRICFQNNNVIDNPLVSICECKGSLEYIHLTCLSNWVSSRTEKICKLNNFNNLNSYYVILRNYYCEICTKPYPSINK